MYQVQHRLIKGAIPLQGPYRKRHVSLLIRTLMKSARSTPPCPKKGLWIAKVHTFDTSVLHIPDEAAFLGAPVYIFRDLALGVKEFLQQSGREFDTLIGICTLERRFVAFSIHRRCRRAFLYDQVGRSNEIVERVRTRVCLDKLLNQNRFSPSLLAPGSGGGKYNGSQWRYTGVRAVSGKCVPEKSLYPKPSPTTETPRSNSGPLAVTVIDLLASHQTYAENGIATFDYIGPHLHLLRQGQADFLARELRGVREV